MGEERFAEIVIWELPEADLGRSHGFKYRLAYVVAGTCVLRFDNEVGKGDHKHFGEKQVRYVFTTTEQLVTDFWNAVENRSIG